MTNKIYGIKVAIKNMSEPNIDYKSPDLMKYLPYYYKQSDFTNNIQDAIAKEIGLLNYYKDDLMKQFFISTATWGLSYYEKELEIEHNPKLTIEQRREIIIAKLRGRGTTTVKMIKNTAESFAGGEVEVDEHNEENYFIIRFVGVKGIPNNMSAFIDMLETIKPAHLNYEIEYTYLTWGDIKKHTWGKLSSYTWGDVMVSKELQGGKQI